MSNNIYERHPDGTEAIFDEMLEEIQEQVDTLERIRSHNPIGLFGDMKVVDALILTSTSLSRRSKALSVFIRQHSQHSEVSR